MTIKIRRSRSLVDEDNDDDQNDCSVSGGLYVVLRVCQIVWVAPVRFRKQRHGWAMRASCTLGVATYIFNTALALSFLGGIVLLESMNGRVKAESLPLTEVILGIGCNLLTMIVPSLMGYTSLGRLRTIVNGLSKIQKAAQIKWSLYKPSRNITVFIAFYFISTSAVAVMNKWFLYIYNFLPQGLLQHGVSDFNRIRTMMTLLQFVFVTTEIRLLLQLANDQLSQLLIKNKAEKGITRLILVKEKPTEDISSLFSTYDTISKVVEEMNDAFGFIIMTVLFLSCWGLVLYPYCVAQSPIPQLSSWPILTFFISESMIYATWLLTVVEPSHRLNREMSRTGHLVSLLSLQRLHSTSAQRLHSTSAQRLHYTSAQRLHYTSAQRLHSTSAQRLHSTSAQLLHSTRAQRLHSTRAQRLHYTSAQRLHSTSAQLQQFHYHLLICKASYRPMHICALDRPLIVTLGGIIITYLVICIQLKQLGDP